MRRSSASMWGRAAVTVGVVVAALLVGASPAHAVAYNSSYHSVRVDGPNLTVSWKDADIPPAVPLTSSWNVTVYYDWDWDGTYLTKLNDLDDYSTDYAKNVTMSVGGFVRSVTLPLDPRYQAYVVRVYHWVGSDTYNTWAVIVNNRAEVVVANDEPTPVRLQEIGLASNASTLAPDVLPVDMETTATVSIPGTLPVDVVSVGAHLPSEAIAVLAAIAAALGGVWVGRAFR